MKLWRVDADFEVDGQIMGMLTWFLLGEPGPWEATLVESGWRCDTYMEDMGAFSRSEIGDLVSRPWPTLPTEDLVAFAKLGVAPTCDVPGDQTIELSKAAALMNDVEQLSPPLANAKQQLQAALEKRGISSARIAWERE